MASFVSGNDWRCQLDMASRVLSRYPECSTCSVPGIPNKRRSPFLLCAPHA